MLIALLFLIVGHAHGSATQPATTAAVAQAAVTPELVAIQGKEKKRLFYLPHQVASNCKVSTLLCELVTMRENEKTPVAKDEPFI
jgi:hypothetical protein